MVVLLFLRSLIVMGLIILISLPMILVLFLGIFIGLGHSFMDKMVVLWGRILGALVFVNVKVEGLENVPTEEGCLYLFSHSSFYDIPVLYGWCPKPFRFGSKEEVFNVPIFGWAMRAVGTLVIARRDREKVIEVYKKAEQRVKNGEAFALAPEGGRRKTNELLPFKSGPFIFATNCKMKVVPTLIQGAEVIMPNGSFFPGLLRWIHPVHLKFLPAIDAADYDMNSYKEFKELVYLNMAKELKKMNQ